MSLIYEGLKSSMDAVSGQFKDKLIAEAYKFNFLGDQAVVERADESTVFWNNNVQGKVILEKGAVMVSCFVSHNAEVRLEEGAVCIGCVFGVVDFGPGSRYAGFSHSRIECIPTVARLGAGSLFISTVIDRCMFSCGRRTQSFQTVIRATDRMVESQDLTVSMGDECIMFRFMFLYSSTANTLTDEGDSTAKRGTLNVSVGNRASLSASLAAYSREDRRLVAGDDLEIACSYELVQNYGKLGNIDSLVGSVPYLIYHNNWRDRLIEMLISGSQAMDRTDQVAMDARRLMDAPFHLINAGNTCYLRLYRGDWRLGDRVRLLTGFSLYVRGHCDIGDDVTVTSQSQTHLDKWGPTSDIKLRFRHLRLGNRSLVLLPDLSMQSEKSCVLGPNLDLTVGSEAVGIILDDGYRLGSNNKLHKQLNVTSRNIGVI